MARSSYQVQHRPRRESKEVEVKTENQQLRSDAQKLRRENARLRRELQKRLPQELETQVEPALSEAPVTVPGPGCPECGSVDMKSFKGPTKTLIICANCKWRKAE